MMYDIRGQLACGCQRLVTTDMAFFVASKHHTKAFCSQHGIRTVMQVLNPATDNWLPYAVPAEWYESL